MADAELADVMAVLDNEGKKELAVVTKLSRKFGQMVRVAQQQAQKDGHSMTGFFQMWDRISQQFSSILWRKPLPAKLESHHMEPLPVHESLNACRSLRSKFTNNSSHATRWAGISRLRARRCVPLACRSLR